MKLRSPEENNMEIIALFLDPKTYEVKMDETFYASINNGSNDGAVFLYLN